MGVAARHPATAMGTWSGWAPSAAPGALSRAGPSLLSDWGLGSASPSLPHHPFESSISSPDLPRVTDRNGRVLSKMPALEGRITRSVLSPNKQEKEALCPPRWPRSPRGPQDLAIWGSQLPPAPSPPADPE